jgi:O-antigen/teichoic acid export membrane protein
MSFDKLLQQNLIWRGFYFVTIMLLNIVFSRFLKAEGSGFVYYLSSFFSLVILIVSISMESGFTYFASGNIIQPNKLAIFALLWIALSGIIVLFFFSFYFQRFEKGLAINEHQYLQYGICYVTGLLLINFFTVLFNAQRDFFLPNFLSGLMNIILILILIIEKYKGASVYTLTSTYFISLPIQGIILVLAFLISYKTWFSVGLPGRIELIMLFRFSFIALIANVVFFCVYRIDYWFVRYNCTAGDLGNYIQASKIGQIILIVPQIIASVMTPQIASGELQQDVSEAIVKLFRLFIQLFIGIALILSVVGNQLFVFVFGASFNHMNLPLMLLLPGILCLAGLSMLSAYFGGKGQLKVNLIGGVYALITVVAGNLIFIKHYSIYVAASVSAVGYAVNLGYSLGHYIRAERLHWKELFHWKRSDWFWLKKMLLNN